MKESRYNVWVERGDAAYVFNGVSGALLHVPQEQRQAIEQLAGGSATAAPAPQLLEHLVRGRMLLADDADELKLLSLRYNASRYDPTIFGVTLVTSLGCNFDCPYCYEAKHPSLMTEEVQQALLTALDDQLPRLRLFRVTWFGGEPLVGKQALLSLSDAFIERCDRAGVAYDAFITTNGSLLDEETCRQLRDRRVTRLQIGGLDGPPEIHDLRRPLAGGKGTFWSIVKNLHHAVEYFPISVRINIDASNVSHVEALLQILAAEGLAGKLGVYPGHVTNSNENGAAPSASYANRCLSMTEFARAERDLLALATRYGFGQASVPAPVATPCTAVRANELVVGSEGELYKCWDDVGNMREVVGNIRDYKNQNGRLQKWLTYDPFTDDECSSCIALPVCMGGCAHHAFNLLQQENRCDTFRFTYQENVQTYVEAAAQRGAAELGPVIALSSPIEPR